MAEILEGFGSTISEYQIHSETSNTAFTTDKIGNAFEFLQNHGNVGKTILSVNSRSQVPISPSSRNTINLDKNSTYVIAGGLGGLGRSLARLLVELGARHIAFLSRSGARTVDAQKLLQELATSEVVAKSYTCDISDAKALQDALQQCSSEMPPIKGIVQSAAVLNGSVYENMTHELWQGAIWPKIQGTQNLHTLLPRDVDFSVMLSSISGLVDNRSQANYAAGNTFQDTLAQHRRKQGLPAVSIDLGLMLGIGLIAQRGGSTNLKKFEAVGLYEDDFHAILITGLPTGGILRSGGLEDPFYFDDPRFSILKKTGLDNVTGNETGGSASSGEADAISQSSRCASSQDASNLISTALCERLAKALETVPENIDSGKPLHTYGVDSLMAVDLRTWILT